MFLIPPIVVAVGSLAGIIVIISRKFPYLKKLEADEEIKRHFLAVLILDLGSFIRNSAFFKVVARYGRTIDDEIMKVLRRWKVLALKSVNVIENMLNSRAKKDATRDPNIQENVERIQGKVTNPFWKREESPEELKAQEQELILQIAKNPKNKDLYLQIGNIYFKMKEYGDAREAYETALKIDPEYKMAQRMVGKLPKNGRS